MYLRRHFEESRTVHGKIKIRDDEKFVRGVVARFTRVNEARTGSASQNREERDRINAAEELRKRGEHAQLRC